MICFSCGHCSMGHVLCPYCGDRTTPGGQYATAVGWSFSDLKDAVPNPFSYAYDKGAELGSSISNSGSTWDAIKDAIPNPFGAAYDAGKLIGDKGQQLVNNASATFDAAASLLTVVKWVVIGGAVVGAVVITYGLIRFIPVALGLASKQATANADFATKFASKHLLSGL